MIDETGAFNDVIQGIIKEKERLQKENEKLKEALRKVCSRCSHLSSTIKALKGKNETPKT